MLGYPAVPAAVGGGDQGRLAALAKFERGDFKDAAQLVESFNERRRVRALFDVLQSARMIFLDFLFFICSPRFEQAILGDYKLGHRNASDIDPKSTG